MNVKINEKIIERVKLHYDYLLSKGYEIVFVALQGSQNYELDIYTDEYISDVDTKAVILPSFGDYLHDRRPISETIVLDNNEHIDVKDVRVMFDNFKKQNINFIEILFTDYKIINEKYSDAVKALFVNNEKIARLNINKALRCMSGMSKEKLNALKHPYPSIKEKIEKFGYDPKQLHHILRMNDFIKKYVNGILYKKCLISDDKQYLINVKKGIYSLEEAESLAKSVDDETYNIKNENLLNEDIVDNEAVDIIDEVKYKLLKQKFKEDLEII